MKSKHIYLISIFIIFIIIFSFTPISGDDFGNYISTNGTFLSAIKTAISYYNTLEGRIVGRILIMYTTHHKLVWNILTALSLTLITSSSFKLLKKRFIIHNLINGNNLIKSRDVFTELYMVSRINNISIPNMSYNILFYNGISQTQPI